MITDDGSSGGSSDILGVPVTVEVIGAILVFVVIVIIVIVVIVVLCLR